MSRCQYSDRESIMKLALTMATDAGFRLNKMLTTNIYINIRKSSIRACAFMEKQIEK